MILIHPQVVSDPEDECGGKLIIVFPEDSGCQTLVVPLKVSENTVKDWDRLSNCQCRDLSHFFSHAFSFTQARRYQVVGQH